MLSRSNYTVIKRRVKNKLQNKVLIVGGGASGLLAALKAAEKGAAVTVIERRERIARKMLVTGKGRCNLTNNCDIETLVANVPRGGRFLYSAFSNWNSQDTMAFFEALGVPLKTERGNRVFPVSDKAMDIVDALDRAAKKNGIRVIHDRIDRLIIENDTVKGAVSEKGTLYKADRVIVATGGLSYPATGSSGDGYVFARQAGHSVTDRCASLTALLSDDSFCADLMGISLRNIGIKMAKKGKKRPVFDDFGELIFTHFGVSGPTILSASAHCDKPELGEYTLHIDLKPALDAAKLDLRICRDFEENKNKDFANSLDALLPKKLIPVVISRLGIPGEAKVNQITKEQRAALLNMLKDFTVHISGTRPIEEAVITRGGVSLKEINPSTMESKLCKSLYFAGEVIDADAYTGGFNLQIAFSTGALAGENAAE